jgi:hypothetical protein
MKRNLTLLFVAATTLLLVSGFAHAQFSPNVLPFAPPSVSTVPSNGDGNPYGVAYVPASVPTDGVLQQGDILVANFNGPAGIQGTGTTIVRVSASGQVSLFFQTSVLGLTGALGILSNGVVIVGNLPTTDGTAATAGPGALTFIDRFGNRVGSLVGYGLHGPWGMAVSDTGTGTATVFVSQVLTGNVARYTFSYNPAGTSVTVLTATLIGSGFAHQPNAGAVVLGPSGLTYDAAHDILYVASSNDNAIYSIANAGSRTATAGTGNIIYNDAAHLHGPLDLAMTPTGHLLVANSDGSNADPKQPSELVEFTVGGQFVSQFSVDPNLGGGFGLATFPISTGALNVLRVAAVDDNANTLSLWTSVVN